MEEFLFGALCWDRRGFGNRGSFIICGRGVEREIYIEGEGGERSENDEYEISSEDNNLQL